MSKFKAPIPALEAATEEERYKYMLAFVVEGAERLRQDDIIRENPMLRSYRERVNRQLLGETGASHGVAVGALRDGRSTKLEFAMELADDAARIVPGGAIVTSFVKTVVGGRYGFQRQGRASNVSAAFPTFIHGAVVDDLARLLTFLRKDELEQNGMRIEPTISALWRTGDVHTIMQDVTHAEKRADEDAAAIIKTLRKEKWSSLEKADLPRLVEKALGEKMEMPEIAPLQLEGKGAVPLLTYPALDERKGEEKQEVVVTMTSPDLDYVRPAVYRSVSSSFLDGYGGIPSQKIRGGTASYRQSSLYSRDDSSDLFLQKKHESILKKLQQQSLLRDSVQEEDEFPLIDSRGNNKYKLERYAHPDYRDNRGSDVLYITDHTCELYKIFSAGDKTIYFTHDKDGFHTVSPGKMAVEYKGHIIIYDKDILNEEQALINESDRYLDRERYRQENRFSQNTSRGWSRY